MCDVTTEASRQRHSIWWWFWTYFVENTLDTKLFGHDMIKIDQGREGVTATTPSWFVVNKSLGCCCRNSLPTIINPLNKTLTLLSFAIHAKNYAHGSLLCYRNPYCLLHFHRSNCPGAIELSHKSHNAPVPYPIMHHSEQKCGHLCSWWHIVRYGIGVLWDLWDLSIEATLMKMNQ